MVTDSWRARYAGLLYALLVAVFVCALSSLTHVLGYVDGIAYDAFVRHTAGDRPVKNILLVESDIGRLEAGDDVWLKMLKALETQHVARVVFTFMPEKVSAAFYDYARSRGNVLFGRKVLTDAVNPDRHVLEPLPAAAGKDIDFGVLTLPVSDYGIYRRHRLYVHVDGVRYPVLETRAVQISSAYKTDWDGEDYRINFEMGWGQLPRVTLDRVLRGDLVDSLVEGRTVIVGYSSPSDIPGLRTPVSPDDELMSLLDVRGAALYTLLSGRMIHTLSWPVLLGVLLLLTLLSLFAYHWLDIRRATIAAVALFALYMAASWYAFAFMLLWVPVVALILAQVLFFLLFYREKTVVNEVTMQNMLLNLAESMKQRVAPQSFYEVKEHWVQVANMLYQTLDLERLILLERVPGDHRVREVQALQCSLDDIAEMRRDYEREPYSTAIAENGPVRLTRTYLRNPAADEEQYLVPLVFGGDVLGFWAFGISREHLEAINDFDKLIRDFARQISELLYHRQLWMARQHEEEARFSDYMGVEGRDRIFSEVRKDVAMLEYRLANLENVMNGLSVAAILYDLFGGVIQVNRRMEDLARNLDLEPYELTALDFIRDLTGITHDRCRRMFREVIMEHGRFSLPVRTAQGERMYILTIQPLYHRDGEQFVETGDAHPFALQGILCELVDVSDMRSHYSIKDQLVERFIFRLRNDLQAVITGSSLLTHHEIDAGQRQHVEGLMLRKMDHILSMFNRSHQFMEKSLESGTSEVYPLDPSLAIRQASEMCREAAIEHKVRIDVALPPFVSLVLAEPGGTLDWVMKTILTLLIQDAVEHSTIEVAVRESEGMVVCSFHNTGFGLPNARLQDCLFGTDPVDGRIYKDMREAILRIREWGGEIEGHAQVGEGIRLILRLKVFFHD